MPLYKIEDICKAGIHPFTNGRPGRLQGRMPGLFFYGSKFTVNMKTKQVKRHKSKVEKKTLSERQIEFAKLVYEDSLRDEEIAKICGIAPSTVYLWKKYPKILKLIDGLGEADTREAKLILKRGSKRAAKSLVALTQTEDNRFVYHEETVRKASCDILEGVEVNVKGLETGSMPTNVVVYLPDNRRQKKAKKKVEES